VVNDDPIWWSLMRDLYQEFKYRNIMTEDIVRFFNARTTRDWTPIFDQYLRRPALPTLQLAFNEPGSMAYRWRADERGFAMPVRVGRAGNWTIVEATTDWKVTATPLAKEEVEVATDLYYINVEKN
jgi:aminopeptidase N